MNGCLDASRGAELTTAQASLASVWVAPDYRLFLSLLLSTAMRTSSVSSLVGPSEHSHSSSPIGVMQRFENSGHPHAFQDECHHFSWLSLTYQCHPSHPEGLAWVSAPR